MIIPAIGVITAVIGIFAVALRLGDRSGITAINRGFFISAVLSAIGMVIACFTFPPADFSGFADITDTCIAAFTGNPRWIALGAILIGIVLASAMQLPIGYFTDFSQCAPDDQIASQRHYLGAMLIRAL